MMMNENNSNLESKLQIAILSRNVEILREILFICPKLCHSFGCKNNALSPLWKAMLLGFEDIVENLIEFGANVNEWVLVQNDHLSQEHKISFFHYLATQNSNFQSSVEVAKVLVQHGANVNLTYESTSSLPIQYAIMEGNTSAVEFLLKNGGRLEGPEWNDNSPVLSVIETPTDSQKEILKLLIEYGVNIEFRGDSGENILHSLVIFSSKKNYDAREIIGIIIDSGVPLDDTTDTDNSPLEFAIYLKNFELCSFLIQKGANINKKSNQGGTFPLSVAALTGDINLVKLLLSNGAKMNAKTSLGRTVLHVACCNCHEEVIEFLLREGAEISAEDDNNETPLAVLNSESDNYDRCLTVMMKEFAKLVFENQLILPKDMNLIQADTSINKHFENCKSELSKMKSTIFYPPYSYYLILKMSKNIQKLANFTMNKEFVQEFEKNLSFSFYEDDLRDIFSEALQFRDRFTIVRSRLNLFKDTLPDVVVKKLAKFLRVEDLPLE